MKIMRTYLKCFSFSGWATFRKSSCFTSTRRSAISAVNVSGGVWSWVAPEPCNGRRNVTSRKLRLYDVRLCDVTGAPLRGVLLRDIMSARLCDVGLCDVKGARLCDVRRSDVTVALLYDARLSDVAHACPSSRHRRANYAVLVYIIIIITLGFDSKHVCLLFDCDIMDYWHYANRPVII